MRNVRLLLEYDGTDFSGWQLQPGARTVQGTLEEAIARCTGARPRVVGAGRTDAGVHALGQVANFPTESRLPPERLQAAINAHLPADLRVLAVGEAPPEFHARRSSLAKTYKYRILNRPEPSPVWRRFAWHLPQRLDLAAMERGAACLLGERDFAAFQASGGGARSTVRRLEELRLEREGDFLLLWARADGFLRHMVRNILGTLVEMGLGRREPADVAGVLASRDRRRAGPTAPAHGLILMRVDYPPEGAGGGGAAGNP